MESKSSALRALHGSLATTTAAFCWFGLATDPMQLVLTAVSALVATLIVWFLWSKGLRKDAVRALAAWAMIFLIVTQVVLPFRGGTWEGYRFDDALGWLPNANMDHVKLEGAGGASYYVVSTDADGYRNRSSWEKGSHLPVLLQGDSNAFGFGLDETQTFCSQWESHGGARCFNGGVPGYDPNHFLFQMRTITAKHTVGTRIILFNIGNDYSLSAFETPYLTPRPYLYVDDSGQRQEVTRLDRPFRKQVYGHHFIYPYRAYDAGTELVSAGRDWGRKVPAWFAHFQLAAFATEMAYPRLYGLYTRFLPRAKAEAGRALTPYYPEWQLAPSERWPEPYRSYRRDFQALITAIGEQPAEKTIVVMFPMRSQVIPEEIPTNAGTPEIDILSLNRMVAAMATQAGLTVVDVTADFQAHPQPQSLFQSDSHLSAEGMALTVEKTLVTLGGARGPTP